MITVHLQKAFAFIAKGLIEKENELEKFPNKYPYSKNLQRGINMFLAACCETGNVGENVFDFADESSFLSHYISLPINKWFQGWDQDIITKHRINQQPFYEYGPFAYRRGKEDVYIATEECVEYLGTQESNIIEGTDERALYEKIIQLSQEDYCRVRRYIIEHPIMTVEERRDILLEFASNVNARESFELAYELFEESGFCCPSCGWTMTVGKYGHTCISDHCLNHLPTITPNMKVDGTSKPLYRLKKGIMRYFALPGKLEIEIAKYCEKKKLKYAMWPQKDTFDIEISFSDGEVWEIDAKAYRNPISLRTKIEKDGGFPAGNYRYGFYVVPTEYTKNKNNYIAIVNKILNTQPNVKCVTLSSIKKKINQKAGAIND